MRYGYENAPAEIGGALMTGMMALNSGLIAARADSSSREGAIATQIAARLRNEAGRRYEAERALLAERERIRELEAELSQAYKAIQILRNRK